MVTDKVLVVADNLHNIGDLALLRQAIFGMQSLSGISDIAIRQWEEPSEVNLRQFGETGCQLGRSKWHFLFSPARLMIVGGGQFIRENVSIKSLLFLNFTLAISSRPAAALAIGGGIVRGRLRRMLWRLALARFKVIIMRDDESLALVRDILPHSAKRDVTCDLVFLPSPLHSALNAGGTPRSVIVAPCFSREENRYIDAGKISSICSHLAAHFNVSEVTIIPHDDRPDVDRPICMAILTELEGAGELNAKLLAHCTLEQAVEGYREGAVVLTNRLHAMIFAILADKPVLVLDDGNPKLRAFAKRFMVGLVERDCTAADLDALLTQELSSTMRAARAQAVALAKCEAERNFQILEEYCL